MKITPHINDTSTEGTTMTLTKKIVRAALYHRVSTSDQDENAARHELQQAAAARGFTIVLDVAETGSGARNDRPGLQQVMSAAKKHKIDVVIVWKLDRWGRSSLDLLSNIRALQDCGVRFIATTQSIDVHPNGDPMSMLILVVLSGVAEFERSIICERTRLGLDKARRDGKKIGRPKGTGVSPSAVLPLRAAGVSWSTIAKQLSCSTSAARRAFLAA